MSVTLSRFADGQRSSSWSIFVAIWMGQFVSWFGSELTGFALAAWLYQRTNSATLVSLVWFSTTFPDILISPLSGTLIDRWRRKNALILSEAGAGLVTAMIAVLAFADRLRPWHAIAFPALIAVFASLQWPAFSAATTMLVPKEELGRANGMTQSGQAFAHLVAPAVAGNLLASVGLWQLLLIDVSTYLFCLLVLVATKINADIDFVAIRPNGNSLTREISEGWQYIRQRAGLRHLAMYFAAVNLGIGFVQPLLTPLLLTFASVRVLGYVMSAAGMAMLLGGILVTWTGGPHRRVDAVLTLTAILGIGVFVCGLKASYVLIGIGVGIAFFCTPIIEASSQAVWQRKTPPELQGRVFAIRKLIAVSGRPIGYLLAGPTADYLSVHGYGRFMAALQHKLGHGRDWVFRFLFMITGIVICLIAVAGILSRSLRNIETEIPDAIP
jgi:DHA3 family macrolide efflux protein-like MFS transporter